MTSNPYESPETVSHPTPQPTASPKLFVRVLVVVGISALLGALFILPTRRCAREAARRMQCSNHLKQIGLALQNYHDDFGCLPPAYMANSDGKPMHSWRVLILPYMEQKALYDRYDFDEPWNGPNNSKLHNVVVSAFGCPSSPSRQSRTDTAYVAIVGPQTAWPGEQGAAMSKITDGTGNTVLVVEMAGSGIHWMEPRDLRFDEMPMEINSPNGKGISSPHPNVALALFADGHTAALTKNTPAEIVRALLTVAGGETIGDY